MKSEELRILVFLILTLIFFGENSKYKNILKSSAKINNVCKLSENKMEKNRDLDKVQLSQKEKLIEWAINALALIMLVAFFLKIVFF